MAIKAYEQAALCDYEVSKYMLYMQRNYKVTYTPLQILYCQNDQVYSSGDKLSRAAELSDSKFGKYENAVELFSEAARRFLNTDVNKAAAANMKAAA